jgi:alanyl-tRNA synthetase
LDQVEIEANRIVWRKFPITIDFIQGEAIEKIQFRKPPHNFEVIRRSKIDSFDIAACGGTHLDSTGEVGLIKILRAENYKGGTRIHFVCGSRALISFQIVQKIISKSSLNLSVRPKDLTEAICRLTTNLRES